MKNRTRKRLEVVVTIGTRVVPRPVMAKRTRTRVKRAVLGWACAGLWLALVVTLGLLRGCQT